MLKITIIGAGSHFTQHIATDILNIEGIDDGIIALVDIDAYRLDIEYRLVKKVIELKGKNWTVVASTDRCEVMEGSDFVINQIEVSGLMTIQNDFEIPLKYGVQQCIGDTMGPGGLFKILRTAPSWIEIIKDIEKLCPNAVILNYTNPMSAITLVANRVTDMPVVGLCHSIQNTAETLAEYLEIPYSELKWRCGGINHMSWFVELSHNGKDMYPVLKEKMKDREFFMKDPVRFDGMEYLGAFVSESSGHFSEYTPYHRKRQDLVDKFCGDNPNMATGAYAKRWPIGRKNKDERILRMLAGEEEINLNTSNEYAAVIIEAMVKNTPKVIYGNVMNKGLIENLPSDGIVEVACMINANGINPCRFGRLPEHMAQLNRSNMAFFELDVEAVLNKDRDAALHALMIDPLTAAVCSLSEIKSMFDELYEADREYIIELK
jgi:alpha-galactosidase